MAIQRQIPESASRPQLITFSQMWQDIKIHRLIIYKVLAAAFMLSVAYSLSIPNYYVCKVMLAPEITNSKGAGSLAGIASSFGINLNNGTSGGDALTPMLYPELMNSVSFRTSLFPVTIPYEGNIITYFEYLKNYQKRPWWSSAVKSLVSLFNNQSSMLTDSINPFQLTEDQSAVAEKMAEKVVCDVDAVTMAITINVTDQDPLVAATMADSVKTRLQSFITHYRTQKARVDLAYNQKLYKETKARYEKARQLYAEFMDANQDVILQTVRQKQTDLENEMQLQYNAYTQVAAQLLAAEAKVQQETPAFTTLQPASVPLKKKGPKRARICLVTLFIAFICTSIYAIHKEGHLSSI